MFDINNYKYDVHNNYLEIGGEAMVFHCHHYIINLQRTILDAKYIKSDIFIIGSAAHSTYNQLSNLCKGLNIEESKKMAEDIYKLFGYGLIDLSNMNENGVTLNSSSSFFSKTWIIKVGKSEIPIDFYTTGFLAAAYCVIYKKDLKNINAIQTKCMSCGDENNTYKISIGECNFKLYPKKQKTVFNKTKKQKLNWEYEKVITDAFLDAHKTMIGNDEGLIPAFGVYLVRNQSDFVNRLQFEFSFAMHEIAGEYGITLAGELLMEAGHACGFFTYGGIMTSNEWNTYVKPYLKSKEDWIRGLLSLVNSMGWGYHTAIEISEKKAIFRNYNDFEDLSYIRMYGESKHPIHWANSGGFTGLMELIYKTNIINDGKLKSEEGFKKMRSSTIGYKTNMTKGISCGDDYLEVEIWT